MHFGVLFFDRTPLVSPSPVMRHTENSLAAFAEAIALLLGAPPDAVWIIDNDHGTLLLSYNGTHAAGSFDELWAWAKSLKRALALAPTSHAGGL
jgi:hypothetical protein